MAPIRSNATDRRGGTTMAPIGRVSVAPEPIASHSAEEEGLHVSGAPCRSRVCAAAACSRYETRRAARPLRASRIALETAKDAVIATMQPIGDHDIWIAAPTAQITRTRCR